MSALLHRFGWLQAKRAARALAAACVVVLAACAATPPSPSGGDRAEAWPVLTRPVDAALEARIQRIVAGMTLEQKIGQMTQADIRSITPADVRTFYIGSILNGGGAWPHDDKHATPRAWATLEQEFYQASMSTDMATPIPIIWGTDAVHGHNNVFGATVFPHNIGLGAARNPELVYRIGRSTARAVRATGITWVFAPTLAVVQDQRWGRTYESYSSDPVLVRRYAESMVRGLQGELAGGDDVVATAKHYLGDGGTYHGVDRGDTRASLADLIGIHAQGYFGALEAGVQTVMVSYSSWNETGQGERGVRMHANHYLITDVLKRRLGFDGIVVSDWNAIEMAPGCTRTECAAAINAGIDMVMVPDDWRGFIRDTAVDVRSGAIPMSRIDDAVSRIIRVKIRAGLFDRDPAVGAYSAPANAIEDASLAREAVRDSLVLIKNARGVLPLARNSRVLVVGAGADDMSRQSGGWTRTWQGTDNARGDFGTGETLLEAIRSVVGSDAVTYSPTGADVDVRRFDVVIAVLSEAPYAETRGDVALPASMSHSLRYPQDLAVLQAVAGHGVPVVSVLYSGRTVYANDLINRSDAFVAAWLPGTEAGGVADVLFRDAQGAVQHDFTGRLPFAWPLTPCDSVGRKAHLPLGFGLSYAHAHVIGSLAEASPLETCAR